MQYQEFLDRVRQRTGLASFAEAEAATQATLTVLDEYLTGGKGLDLASQLPQGLAELLRRQPSERSMIFSLNDFLQRVGEDRGSRDRRGLSPRLRRHERSGGSRHEGRDGRRPPAVS